MVVYNKENSPTFVRGDSVSFIDITCSTQKVATQIHNWQILEEETLSDHKFIYFEIAYKKLDSKRRRIKPKHTMSGKCSEH
nr:unnamed protein product [Callosobruchus analis]